MKDNRVKFLTLGCKVNQYETEAVSELFEKGRTSLIKGFTGKTKKFDAFLKINEDKTVDIYFGPKAPNGKESNWIPTKAGEKFEVLFRFYGAEKPIFDKTWVLPDVEKID